MEEDSLLLRDFINAAQQNCGLPLITSLEVKNPFNLKIIYFDKESVLDIKAVSETGEIFNIEVQTSGSEIFKNRSLYYWAKLYSSQLKQGKKYNSLYPVICINILDFKLFAQQDRCHLCFMLRDIADPELFLTDRLAIHYLELSKLVDYNSGNELEKWLYYLKNEGKAEFVIRADTAPVRTEEHQCGINDSDRTCTPLFLPGHDDHHPVLWRFRCSK